jgi:hypothetical protein
LFTIDAEEARRALRNEGVFGPLRVHAAAVLSSDDAAAQVPLFADVAAHASLRELHLCTTLFGNPEVLGALVGAALSLPLLRTVELMTPSRLSPATAPALARLLSSGTLTELIIQNDAGALSDAPSAVLLSDALRANARLTSLTLGTTQLWSNHAAAAALLSALTGHASLRELRIRDSGCLFDEDRQHAGVLLCALVAANAPALTALDVSHLRLSDIGLRPLFEALPGNSHLRELNCAHNNITDAFAADVLLPAVRDNATLRTLIMHALGERTSDAAREAEALVKSRSGEAAPPAR